ncbi:MAG: hypothetical protein RL173_386 [Fibrobacterota bacterium]
MLKSLGQKMVRFVSLTQGTMALSLISDGLQTISLDTSLIQKETKVKRSFHSTPQWMQLNLYPHILR